MMDILQRPRVYQKKKTFFNCFDYPVCLYLTNQNVPYQYLYSGNWTFRYRAVDDLSANVGGDDSKAEMLRAVYKTELVPINEDSLARAFERARGYVLTCGDGWHLPWTFNYKREHRPHWFLALDYRGEDSTVRIVDKIPEHDAREDVGVLDAAFRAGGSTCYEFSGVEFEMNAGKLKELLEECRRNIDGRSPNEGLQGLRRFREDILARQEGCLDYVNRWWDQLKDLLDLRDQFVEFVYFLACADDSPVKGVVEDRAVETFDRTVNKWLAFRNGLLKTAMNRTFDYKRVVERLDNIIASEEECARELDRLMERWGCGVER